MALVSFNSPLAFVRPPIFSPGFKKLPEKSRFKKPGHYKHSLQISEEFVLVLMTLNLLGLTERHLADTFSVTKSTVSRVYITWIHFLALTLKVSLLRRPSKEEGRVPMSSFSKYPDTRIIVDSTEFFIEKPSSPSA